MDLSREQRRLRNDLIRVTHEPLPLPGGGLTSQRFARLFELGRHDLELARLAEAHYDAHAIAADLGASLREGLYGVWAASGPDPLTATRVNAEFDLVGNVPWCSGLGVVDRALVVARDTGGGENAGGLLFDVSVEQGRIVSTGREWSTPAFAATGTATLHYRTRVSNSNLVGQSHDYFARPAFWHNAIGVSAGWAGGLRGVLDLYEQRWKRTDPHSLGHLGSASAWAEATKAIIAQAGLHMDERPHDYEWAQAHALRVRHVVERACITALDHLAVGGGPEPLAFDADIIRRTQQLQLYIRQCHGVRDLVAVGERMLVLRASHEVVAPPESRVT